MRSLSATLTSNQKAGGDALLKAVFTKSGETTRTYDISSTTNRILRLTHPEQEFSQVAQVLVDNREGNLTGLNLEGYQGVLSYGFNDPTQGDEFSATAPLEVISQKQDTLLNQGVSDLVTSFGLAGVFNFMGEDHALVAYTPDSTNTDTVKTILTAIANATLTGFTHTKSYTIIFDSEDSLIDSLQPKDYFSVNFEETRLSAFRKALAWTGCKARIESDGAIHISVPTILGTTWAASTAYVVNNYVQPTTPNNNFAYRCTTAGTSGSSEPTFPTTAGGTVSDGTVVWTAVDFDYEYNDADVAANHNFFEKSIRTRLVIPTKFIVSSPPTHALAFIGSATDSASETALGRSLPRPKHLRVTSNAQCVLIATALLLHRQLGAEKGHGSALMNVGQEVMDFIKITDSVANDLRIGNIGFLQRNYSQGEWDFQFRFGDIAAVGLAGTMPPRGVGGEDVSRVTYDDLRAILDYSDERDLELAQFFIDRDTVPKWHITQEARAPVE